MSLDSYDTILQNRVLVDVEVKPITRKFFIQPEPPSLLNNLGDIDRLKQALPQKFRNADVPLPLFNKASELLWDNNFNVTVTLAMSNNNWQVIQIEPGDTTSRHYGIAVDIGTTTVVAYLVDLTTGNTIGTAADYNGQVDYGDDVLTRIYLASDEAGRKKLQQAIIDTLNGVFLILSKKFNIDNNEISAITIGANTTMVHLLLGLNPSKICMSPYIPMINHPGAVAAGSIGLLINPFAPVYCLPSVGSYVGGDIIGGILASGMHKKNELALFVDIGTNGEMVLGNCDWLAACSGAAGPALEGGVAKHGMRAEPGAVYQVKIKKTGEVVYKTIESQKPRGICGSGLVDCLAELLLAGVINRAGKFKGNKREFVVVPAEESENGMEITFTQNDIDNIMRTKGAVNAALELLLESVGCKFEEIDTFYASGAFGQYLDLESAVTIGLYPDLKRERMIRLGNSSGEGARLVLISEDCLREAEKISNEITYFELNASEVFMNKFRGSKFLPHTNMDYYPTVKKRMQERGLAVD